MANIVTCVCYVTHPQFVPVAKEEFNKASSEVSWDNYFLQFALEILYENQTYSLISACYLIDFSFHTQEIWLPWNMKDSFYHWNIKQ